ncbi:MAG TPA: hypothetical protein VJV78_06450 [Polyangiales bacterium]|nr:hypothetical protein [Polyangiales bacterium]
MEGIQPKSLIALCASVIVTCGGCATPEGSKTPPRTPQPAAINRCASTTAEAEEPPSPAETQQNYCRPLGKRQSELAEKALLDSYKRRFAPSRVIVDFACDTVQQLNDVDLEFGDQKSHRLVLLHFERVDEDGHYEVWGIDVRASEDRPRAHDYRSAEHFTVSAARLQLAASALDVEAVRTRLVTTVHEVQFSDGTPSAFGFEEASSIHRLVLLSGENSDHVYDAAGLIQHEMLVSPSRFERRYTGRVASNTQHEYLPLELASKLLLEAVPAEAFVMSASEEHRRLIRTRFAADFTGAPWWLRELFLVLAARLGSPHMVPALLEAARQGEERQRTLAVSALAAITGWDVRFTAAGAARPSVDVAADYARECGQH